MTVLTIFPPKSIALLGGSGFLGRAIARQLAQAGYQVKILTRSAHRAQALTVLPQVQVIEIGPESASLSEALLGCSAAVNLVGILHESGSAQFDEVHLG